MMATRQIIIQMHYARSDMETVFQAPSVAWHYVEFGIIRMVLCLFCHLKYIRVEV